MRTKSRLLAMILLSLLLAAPAAASASAQAATVTASASVSESSGEVRISGTLETGEGKMVTLWVTRSNGTVIYIDQQRAGVGGAYSFGFRLPEAYQGQYTAAVGGEGVTAPKAITFSYSLGGDDAGSRGSTAGGTSPVPSVNITPRTIELPSRAIAITVSHGVTRAQIDGAELADKLESVSGSKVTIPVGSDTHAVEVSIPASAVHRAMRTAPDAVISIESPVATYDLPIQALAAVGVSLASATQIHVSMEILKDSVAAPMLHHAQANGLLLRTQPIDFTVSLETNGIRKPFTSFGNVYIHRTMQVPALSDPAKATGVLLNPMNGEFHFVPAYFKKNGDTWTAALKRSGNSIYAVAEFSKIYSDLLSHWAKQDIELMSTKLVVNGITEEQFAPELAVSRAQFAAMLVRGLGLTTSAGTPVFTDVTPSDWFAGAAATASEIGLISGYEDGSFQPNHPITREEMAVMISRALHKVAPPKAIDSGLLVRFTDQGQMSPWAVDSIAVSLQAGLMTGLDAGVFAPREKATRAQATVILKRFLQHVQFIN